MDTIADWSHVLRLDLLAKLALATFLGGVVGWERETAGKPAGLRTNILICVGAAILADLSMHFARLAGATGLVGDPARLAAQIVSGVGFLGAGTIMQARGTVTGLTSAATLWVVAAIGMTAGAGAFIEATGATLLVLVILWPLGWVEDRIEAGRRGRTIRVVVDERAGKVDGIQAMFEDVGLGVRVLAVVKAREGESEATFEVHGPTAAFRRARAELLEMPEVRGVFRV